MINLFEDAPSHSNDSRAAAQGDAGAKQAAAEFLEKAGAGFRSLDASSRIYTVALAVTLIASVLFSAVKVNGFSFGSMAGAGFGGLLVVVGSLAGIGLVIWTRIAQRRDAWIPLATAGAAAVAALAFVLVILRLRGLGHLTLPGFYLPMAAAITATSVAVRRIARA